MDVCAAGTEGISESQPRREVDEGTNFITSIFLHTPSSVLTSSLYKLLFLIFFLIDFQFLFIAFNIFLPSHTYT